MESKIVHALNVYPHPLLLQDLVMHVVRVWVKFLVLNLVKNLVEINEKIIVLVLKVVRLPMKLLVVNVWNVFQNPLIAQIVARMEDIVMVQQRKLNALIGAVLLLDMLMHATLLPQHFVIVFNVVYQIVKNVVTLLAWLDLAQLLKHVVKMLDFHIEKNY